MPPHFTRYKAYFNKSVHEGVKYPKIYSRYLWMSPYTNQSSDGVTDDVIVLFTQQPTMLFIIHKNAELSL